jgi:hypothetical protein
MSVFYAHVWDVKSPAPAFKQEPGLITFNPYGLIIT